MASLKPGNEREPTRKVPITYRPANSLAHYVADGENWQSLSHRYGIDANVLIRANFSTNHAQEVNWYLHYYVCCDTTTPDGYNWRFSSTARRHADKSPRAGIIYIPPKEMVFDEGDTIVVEIERLVFDGKKLRWMRGGRTIASWPAASGKPGYQEKGYQSFKGKRSPA
jgi:hypothetical protein